MLIQSIHSVNPRLNITSFKAREYATARTIIDGTTRQLKIFEIFDNDRCFLDFMSMNLNLEKLSDFKNLSQLQLRKWKGVINDAICMSSYDNSQRSFLLVTEKKRPCGIITYNNNGKTCQLDYLATWPESKGQKVKLAGTILVKTLFDDLLKTNANSVTLTTLNNSPVDLLSFYEKMSFVPYGNVVRNKNIGIDMFSLRSWFKEKSKELTNYIKIDLIDNPVNYDLKKNLDVKF